MTEFIFKGLKAGGDQMLPVLSLLNAIFRIKSCFVWVFFFSLSVGVNKFGILEKGDGNNLCNTAVIFNYILKTINDQFVLIS